MRYDFEEYIRGGDAAQREKARAWQTAIGLQAVDDLKVSDYLIDTARQETEGTITLDEANDRLLTYYSHLTTSPSAAIDKQREADNAAANIRRLLCEQAFSFSLAGFMSIHRRIFEGIFPFAGQLRDYNITKKERVLNGDTVLYAPATDLRMTIEYDLEQERNFDYRTVNRDAMVAHLARFVAGLWQIHPFGEGNTRTTAVFTIKYLRSLGFEAVDNDPFEHNALYFRNALVRANYQNLAKGIAREPRFLLNFFRNILLGEHNELDNRELRVPLLPN